jgi:hypothetical protein
MVNLDPEGFNSCFKNDYLQLVKKHAKLHEGRLQLGLCKLDYHVKPIALTKVRPLIRVTLLAPLQVVKVNLRKNFQLPNNGGTFYCGCPTPHNIRKLLNNVIYDAEFEE